MLLTEGLQVRRIGTDARPKETDDALLFLFFREGAIGPGIAKTDEGIQIDRIEELVTLGCAPGQKLLRKIPSSLERVEDSSSRDRASLR